MKKIIVPTDFSENAATALPFAKDIAARKNEKLLFYHAYHAALPTTADPISLGANTEYLQTENDIVRHSKEHLQNIQTSLGLDEHNSDVLTETGAAAEGLAELSKNADTDLIVMGTNGAQGAADVIFGSVASVTMREAECPVLAIPPDTVFKPFENILIATDLNHKENSVYKYVIELAKLYNAEVKFLHVNDNEEDAAVELGRARTLFDELDVSYDKITFYSIASPTPELGIQDFIKESDVDLLVMITHTTSFFDRLFHRSLTKKMALHTDIPLLAFSQHYSELVVL